MHNKCQLWIKIWWIKNTFKHFHLFCHVNQIISLSSNNHSKLYIRLLTVSVIFELFLFSLVALLWNSSYFRVQTLICNNDPLNHLIMREFCQEWRCCQYQLKITEPNIAIQVRWSLTNYHCHMLSHWVSIEILSNSFI